MIRNVSTGGTGGYSGIGGGEGGGLAFAGTSTGVISSDTILNNTVNGGTAGADDTGAPGGSGANGEGGGIFVDMGSVIQLDESTVEDYISNLRCKHRECPGSKLWRWRLPERLGLDRDG